MSSLSSSTNSQSSFDEIRKTAKQTDYQINSEEDFLKLYSSDPFFREKINYRLEEAEKKKKSQPQLNSIKLQAGKVEAISHKLCQNLSDQELIEECNFYRSIIGAHYK